MREIEKYLLLAALNAETCSRTLTPFNGGSGGGSAGGGGICPRGPRGDPPGTNFPICNIFKSSTRSSAETLWHWKMCISARWPEPQSSPTVKTNILLYISIGSRDVKAVGSCMRDAGNLSMTAWNKKKTKIPLVTSYFNQPTIDYHIYSAYNVTNWQYNFFFFSEFYATTSDYFPLFLIPISSLISILKIFSFLFFIFY